MEKRKVLFDYNFGWLMIIRCWISLTWYHLGSVNVSSEKFSMYTFWRIESVMYMISSKMSMMVRANSIMSKFLWLPRSEIRIKQKRTTNTIVLQISPVIATIGIVTPSIQNLETSTIWIQLLLWFLPSSSLIISSKQFFFANRKDSSCSMRGFSVTYQIEVM